METLLQVEALAALRGHIANIIGGTLFVFIGLASCGIAAMRRRSGVRVLVWLGLWSALYGARPLVDSLSSLALLPHWFRSAVPFLDTVNMYLILVVATLAWLELTAGKLRLFLQAVIALAGVIALSGIVIFLFTGVNNKMIPFNNLLATCSLTVLVTVVAVPGLARKYLITPNSGVLLVGTLAFAVEALYTNVARPLQYQYQLSVIWDWLGFAALLLSFGYVALQVVFASERRLLAIESELAVAREIQNSILPAGSPETKNLRIAAVYRPMADVAGDFYEFIAVDPYRVGVLVADVSGHGVPAALIAAMIKVAIQFVVPCAHDPREVLGGLNRILSGQPRDQFVTAAYLWLDTENRKALYSAAGHPPLLRWRDGQLQRIESNGLVFGVIPDPDYPVCEMRIHPCDRFVLYTDGVIEPENARGDSFGDHELEQVVHKNQSRPPSEFADQLLSEIRLWQPASLPQQDDITLIVIDVT
ncbi:MAG TPA: PP2C family protein-serine/threonine phosphatase [Candidatus Angelobacter sp.]|nr:PP2C family protein-serine/threonine phosphatase [Candidatus Angelobacter sp.]